MGINPFDQWGVELGKAIAGELLDGTARCDPSTADLMQRAGL
jgi:glucose-6-phosphate isomerase